MKECMRDASRRNELLIQLSANFQESWCAEVARLNNIWSLTYLEKWLIKPGTAVYANRDGNSWELGTLLCWYTDTDSTSRFAIVQFADSNIQLFSPQNVFTNGKDIADMLREAI